MSRSRRWAITSIVVGLPGFILLGIVVVAFGPELGDALFGRRFDWSSILAFLGLVGASSIPAAPLFVGVHMLRSADRDDVYPHPARTVLGWASCTVVLPLVFAAFGVVQMNDTRENAYRIGIRVSLENLVRAQRDHLRENGAYAERLSDLDFLSRGGVDVELRADSAGWSASAVHSEIPDFGCAAFEGLVPRPQRTPGGIYPSAAGKVTCDER